MIENQKYTVLELPNGMRAVCWQTDTLVSYIGVDIAVGSRDEDESRHGLAHLVEHTIFKGTPTRRAWQVSNRMESVGGELNAYTSKEETMIYTTAPASYEARAFELLADLVENACFPEPDVETEKDVVVEEIKSYLDSPSDSVYDDFEELAYKGSGLAHNILGTEEGVKRLSGKDCQDFVRSYYAPSRMVAYCCSPLPPEKVERLFERHFGKFSRTPVPLRRIAPEHCGGFDEVSDRDGHQANTIVGARVFGRHDERRYPLFLLNNYLGGPSMNSLLNRELREKRGYVYAVDSSVSLMSDAGLMQIYFGSDKNTVKNCRKIIMTELDRLAQSPIKGMAFDRIKRQYCGQLLVSSANMENRAMTLARSVLHFGRVSDVARTASRISAVTPEEMREVAEMILGGGLSCLTLM